MPDPENSTERPEDAVLRFLQGADDNDTELVASAFTEAATMDITALRGEAGLVRGRDVIAETIIGSVGRLDTTHQVSNIRIVNNGERVGLTCYVVGMHFRPGQGPDPAIHDHLLLGNRYRMDLVHDSNIWRIDTLVVTVVWQEGSPAVVSDPGH